VEIGKGSKTYCKKLFSIFDCQKKKRKKESKSISGRSGRSWPPPPHRRSHCPTACECPSGPSIHFCIYSGVYEIDTQKNGIFTQTL
jgi:hypothetical protein